MTANIDHLKVGAFYWVIPAFNPDTDESWNNALQPARYEGAGLWSYLGESGVSDWPTIWVGNEIADQPSQGFPLQLDW